MGHDHPEILSAEARTKQRDQAAADLVRALLIINAGGAGALLLFLQTIWSSDKALAGPTVVALVILSVGAVLGAAFHLLRYEASWYHQNKDLKRWGRFRLLYLIAAYLSLLAFVAGVGVVAIGAYNALDKGIKPRAERSTQPQRSLPSF
jgi:hypothetical protein